MRAGSKEGGECLAEPKRRGTVARDTGGLWIVEADGALVPLDLGGMNPERKEVTLVLKEEVPAFEDCYQ
jgi:hypothetical protein